MKKNKKGQMQFLGVLLVAFVGVVVAIALFNGGITENVASVTTVQSTVNDTVAAPAAGSTINLRGIAASSFVAINSSADVVPASNYTVSNYQLDSTGLLTAQLTPNEGYSESQNWNVTYTYEPEGYATSSGSRAVSSLVILLSALAIGLYVLGVALNKGLLDNFR